MDVGKDPSKNPFIIHIYTDGSSKGNPGPGGYGIIMEVKEKNIRKEFSQGFRLTTNNRMELLAVIIALEKIKYPYQSIKIFSDSLYVMNPIKKSWLLEWEKKDFKNKKNPDLWKRFLISYKKHHIDFIWVKGHNKHLENERCDYLASHASKSNKLSIDYGYEKQMISN